MQEFIAFFHNGQIGSKVCIVNIIKAHAAQSTCHAFHGCFFSFQTKVFTPCCTHCRSNLYHGDFFLIRQSSACLAGIITFTEGTYGTMGDTLTAQGTVGILDDTVAGNINCCTAAGTSQIPDIQCLHLIADLDAAHTFDTFIEISVQRECFCPCTAASACQLCFIGQFQNAQIICQILQLTVAAAYTGSTFAVMLRQDQLHVDPSGITGTGRIGMYDHAFFHRVTAGSNHGSFPFHLYAADAAGGNFVDIF